MGQQQLLELGVTGAPDDDAVHAHELFMRQGIVEHLGSCQGPFAVKQRPVMRELTLGGELEIDRHPAGEEQGNEQKGRQDYRRCHCSIGAARISR